MKEIQGKLINVAGNPASGMAIFRIKVNNKVEEYWAEVRMLHSALEDGEFKPEDDVYAMVDGGSLYSFGHLEE